jgi:hypothetical protein
MCVCVQYVIVIKNCIEPFKLESGTAKTEQYSHGGEELRASINIQLVRIRLVLSVDLQHGTGMDHIVSTLASLPGIK